MMTWNEQAATEAENELARRSVRMWQTEGEHLSHSWGEGFKRGFTEGAAWAQEQHSTLPERFRDPEKLAKYVIENEWALDSKINPSGRADWRETLQRVRDDWDADTPGDLVSTIAAAIRLDRHFYAVSEGDSDDDLG